MIFITVGFQVPFGRLINAIDQIAPSLKNIQIIAQTAKTNCKVKNIKTIDFVPPEVFNTHFNDAQLIVSHAGMGTILSALELEKPIIVMPRLTKYGEVTTDHQLATAKKFEKQKYIHVAYDKYELEKKLKAALNGDLAALRKINKYASKRLINSIISFIQP